MNDKEAIERLNRMLIAESTTNNIATRVYISDLRIALNLIEKQKAEIEFQKDINNTEKERHKQTEKSLKGIINKQNKEIETLKRDFEIVDHECSRLEQEDIRKDKIINLMASHIKHPKVMFTGGRGHQHIIEYFENKVKESK